MKKLYHLYFCNGDADASFSIGYAVDTTAKLARKNNYYRAAEWIGEDGEEYTSFKAIAVKNGDTISRDFSKEVYSLALKHNITLKDIAFDLKTLKVGELRGKSLEWVGIDECK